MNLKKIKIDLAVNLAKLIAKLPLTVILMLGGSIGWLTWATPNKRKKVAQRNIELCFPELSKEQQKKLLKDNLISTGKGFAETLIAYWGKTDKFIDRFQVSGLEHVEKALKEGKGCLLMGIHLHPLELSIRVINTKISRKGHMLARQHNNKIFEAHVEQARKKHCEKTIDKKGLRSVFKSLKGNNPVFYIPDQNFSYQCLYIDFFKQPASTVIAPARLAQSSGTPVIAWFGFRKRDENNKWYWQLSLHKPLDYFHTDETEISLTKMTKLFEQQISKHPEQYLWAHRRFKNHPEGKNHVYRDL
jgi:KDO2-lipid IV(A) lauroyltransferase